MVSSIRHCLSEIRIQLSGKLEKHLKLFTAEVLSLSVSVVKVSIPPTHKYWGEAAADLCIHKVTSIGKQLLLCISGSRQLNRHGIKC